MINLTLTTYDPDGILQNYIRAEYNKGLYVNGMNPFSFLVISEKHPENLGIRLRCVEAEMIQENMLSWESLYGENLRSL